MQIQPASSSPASIGVLGLDTAYYKPLGHIKNPQGFSFPMRYANVPGASMAKMVHEPQALTQYFVEAAKALESQGVKAITGSCGLFALYQETLAEAVSIPVFSSSLVQLPMVYTMMGRRGTVGVMTSNSGSITDELLSKVGAEDLPLAIQGMEGFSEFRSVVLEGQRQEIDFIQLETEIRMAARQLKFDTPDMKAVVVECTDMSPFVSAIEEETRLPVFDLTTLTKMVQESVAR